MKSSYVGLAAVGLAVAGLWYAGGGAAVPPQSAAAAELPRVSAPLAHDNLTVFFVHGPDAVTDAHKVATLQEALEAGWAVVIETGEVNTLAVENRSDEYELFIQDGEMIKGGKQDRMIAGDMLVPPKSGVVPFRAHCVEQGRWTGRKGEAVTHFHTSDQLAVGNELRLANASHQQGQVWENVKKNQDKWNANLGVKVNAPESESSLQLALENKTLQDRIAAFEAALRAAGEDRKNVVGVVFVVNGQVTAAEVYGSNALFQKAWPKLLRSQAAGAVADKTDKPCPPAPTAREVERFLAVAANADVTPAGANTDMDTAGVLLTDGTVNRTNFSGRSTATRSGLVRSGGAVNNEDLDRVRNNINAIEANRTWAVQNGAQLFQPAGGQQPAGPQPAPNANPALAQGTLGRALGDNLAGGAPGALGGALGGQLGGQPQPLPQPAAFNPDGNRLTVNRVDNAAGLVTESRDPNRKNAVIHKSFIKK